MEQRRIRLPRIPGPRDPKHCRCERDSRVRFAIHAPGASKVTVVGDFNGWDKTSAALQDPDGDGVWTLTLSLKEGTYQYGFLVDNERWIPDPGADSKVSDGFGGVNSVLRL